MKPRVALGLLVLPLLVACSSSGPQAAEPPPLSSLLATPSPTPSPPPPSVIKAAVQAYVAGVNIAFRTGDTSKGLQATAPTCKCREQLAGIAGVYARHQHFVGTHIVIVRITVGQIGSATAAAGLAYRIPKSAIANAKGKSRPLPARPPANAGVTVELVGHQWLVAALTGLPVVGPRPPKSRGSAQPTPAPQPHTNTTQPSGGGPTGGPSHRPGPTPSSPSPTPDPLPTLPLL